MAVTLQALSSDDFLAPSQCRTVIPAPTCDADRAARLAEEALRLRRLARDLRRHVRRHLRAARLARDRGDRDRCRERARQARQVNRRAVKCDAFALLCEGRALRLRVRPLTVVAA
jgi:hypothetical protein